MDFSISLAGKYPLHDIPQFGRHAEEFGFSRLWVNDENTWRSAYLTTSILGTGTSTIKFGPGLPNPLTRHPVVTAVELATLHTDFDGRGIVGIGPGDYWFIHSLGMNWQAILPLYDLQPDDFEQVIAAKGIGPGTLRGLPLIAELIYGSATSWNDPVKYAFTVGGKDGVPYPVDIDRMEFIASHLRSLVEQAKLGQRKTGYLRLRD